MRLRVRFSDGKSAVLQDVAPNMRFDEFLSLIRRTHDSPSVATKKDAREGVTTPKLVIAGPPPRPIKLSPDDSVGACVNDGDCILVEKNPSDAGPSRHASENRCAIASRSSSRNVVHRCPRGRSRAFARAGAGRVLGDSSSNIEKDRNPLDIAQQNLGGVLVNAVSGTNKPRDGGSRAFRDSLKEAREAKEQEAVGQRRYEAYLQGKYEMKYFRFEGESAVVFRVKYLPVGYRRWREDPDVQDAYFPALSKRLLGAVLENVLTSDNEENIERLKPGLMAQFSPRVFWNLARHFKNDMESGLQELVPNANWSFLHVRKRVLSEKAKRNLEQQTQLEEEKGTKRARRDG